MGSETLALLLGFLLDFQILLFEVVSARALFPKQQLVFNHLSATYQFPPIDQHHALNFL